MLDGISDRIVNVSPSAAGYIDRKGWLEYSEDVLTERKILNDLYTCMTEDLASEYGILFSCDLGELFSSDYCATYTIRMMEVVSDRWLVPFLDSHKELIPLVRDLVESVQDGDRVLSLLEYVNAILLEDDLTSAIQFLRDKVKSNLDFVAYLRAVSHYTEKDQAALIDPETAGKIIALLTERREFCVQVENKLVPYQNVIDTSRLSRLGQRYGQWLLKPENINLACAYFKASSEVRQFPVLKKFMRAFLDGSPFHLGYYRPRVGSGFDGILITDTEIAMIYLGQQMFPFDLTRKRTLQEVIAEVQKLYDYTPNDKLFEITRILDEGISTMHKELAAYIIANPECLRYRSFLIGAFSTVSYPKVEHDDVGFRLHVPKMSKYQLVDMDGQLAVVEDFEDRMEDGIWASEPKLLGELPKEAPLSWQTEIQLRPGDLPNVKEAITTTLGRFTLNYLLAVLPAGELIPYINADLDISNFENPLVDLRLKDKITNEDLDVFVDNAYQIGTLTELAVPTFTEKSIQSAPGIQEYRKKLMEENKDHLDDPVVLSKIEDAVIAYDKEYLKDDPSLGFYVESKSFDIHRKTMYATGGIVPKFGQPGYNFITNSLEEGWRPEDFAKIANEVRRGSYERGTETAKGGEATKFILRIFQDAQIVEDDCGTKRTVPALITKDNMNGLIDHNIMIGGKVVTLTHDNISQYLGQTVNLRSAMTCESKTGYCYTCISELYRKVGQDVLTTHGVSITSTFLKQSLKSMHGTKVETKEISLDILDSFVV